MQYRFIIRFIVSFNGADTIDVDNYTAANKLIKFFLQKKMRRNVGIIERGFISSLHSS